MAGTDDEAVAAGDDDALYVLTAVLLTPAQFPSVLGDDYPEACAALALAPLSDGYGLVLGQDGDGSRWTVVIDDVSLVAVAIASWDCGMEYDLSPDERSMVAALPGWPLAVAVAAPGVPAPHDPPPDIAEQAPLSPPDTSTWGPAQRRLGADEIALQWAAWREQIDDNEFAGQNGEAPPEPDTQDDESGKGGQADDSGSTPSPASSASSRRLARTWTRHLPSAEYGRPSPRVTRGCFGPTGRAGRWWPGPTTSPSCSSTRSPAKFCRSAAGPNCPGCWRRWTRSPYVPAEPGGTASGAAGAASEVLPADGRRDHGVGWSRGARPLPGHTFGRPVSGGMVNSCALEGNRPDRPRLSGPAPCGTHGATCAAVRGPASDTLPSELPGRSGGQPTRAAR